MPAVQTAKGLWFWGYTMIGKQGIKTAVFGVLCNFFLFLIKLYVGISTNSLAIYVDSVNNLGDTLSCLIAIAGFAFVLKTNNEKKGGRIQSLSSFVIGIIVAVTGASCVYSGLERFMYPLPVSYSRNYAILICLTAVVKLVMGFVYIRINRKNPSPVFKALILDSFLDFGITVSAVTGFFLVAKLGFAADGIIGIAIGTAIVISAVKSVWEQAKNLVNE